MIRWLILALAICPVASVADPVSCRAVEHKGNAYTLCAVDVAAADLRLFLYDETGVPYGHFRGLRAAVSREGKELLFAMNAGMYHPDRAPVGHYVEDGQEYMRVVPGPGPGNFGMVPNGVFCIRERRADVFETGAFLRDDPDCVYASQSGPMLVIDGALHPRFLPDSTSRYVRNGVGSTPDGRYAVFAISGNPVTFHDFASLFRDTLGMANALYFDGNVSRLYAPDIGRMDSGRAMGPIVGVLSQGAAPGRGTEN